MNIFAIGDIHGCLNELTSLHKKILTHDKFDVKNDLIIYLGDYIDRGKNSKEVINQILKIKKKEIKTVNLMGNHDEFMIDFLFNSKNNIENWLNFGLDQTLRSYGIEVVDFIKDGFGDDIIDQLRNRLLSTMSEEHINFFKSLELSFSSENYLFVHAGIDPKKILEDQTKEDFLIYDADDLIIQDWLKKNKVQAQLLPFSLEKEFIRGAFLKKDEIIIRTNTDEFKMGITSLALQGNHNVKNAMAASMTAQLLRVRKETIRESLESFEGAEHRLEKVLKINGVEYINDSKATNVNATFYALDSMQTQTVWIVGGVDKGNDYFELMPLVREKVKAIICLGLDNQKIIQTFGNVIDLIVETAGAEEAVKVAYKIAGKGESVLLSPACASFDLFDSYEDRGRQFKQAVREL